VRLALFINSGLERNQVRKRFRWCKASAEWLRLYPRLLSEPLSPGIGRFDPMLATEPGKRLWGDSQGLTRIFVRLVHPGDALDVLLRYTLVHLSPMSGREITITYDTSCRPFVV